MAPARNLKTKLTDFLYKLGLGKRESAPAAPVLPDAVPETARQYGTTGLLEVPTLLLTEDDKIVLMVDYDFEDFPSWVEWDIKTRTLSVVQMGGAAAQLALTMPMQQLGALNDKTMRLMLITGRYERRNGHYVSFIVRE